MTVNNVSTAISPELRTSATRFFLPGATEFAGTLNLGQIIKGQVMRQYEGNRYLVSFGGHERVVDSVVPLTTGELIHGRVVALGERVELQRVYPQADNPPASAAGAVPAAEMFSGFARHARLVEDHVARYIAPMSAADKAVLARAARMAGDPGSMVLAGITVNKLGLSQSPEVLWPLYRTLVREDATSAALYKTNEALELRAVAAGEVASPAAALRPLAEALAKQMEQSAARKDSHDLARAANTAPERHTPSPLGLAAPKAVNNDADEGRGSGPRWLAHRLLNAQTGGAVAHRVGTIPLLLGNQLIEVDLAFFDQREEKTVPAQTKHRKVVFALRTEHLGHVEITAHVSGSHMRLQIAADTGEATAEMSGHIEELRAALAAGGAWEIDEIAYATRQADSHNGVVRSVVEYVISQDSLNRLV